MTTIEVPTPPPPPAVPSPPKYVQPKVRWRSVAPLLAIVGVAVTLAFTLEPLLLLAVLFVVIVPFEKLFPRHRQPLRRARLGTDIAYAITSAPLGAVGVVVGIVLSMLTFAWVPGLLLRPIVQAVPTTPRLLLGIALFDLGIYWVHRFGHEVPFMWRFHRIHHSTEHLDWVSGFRGHPLDGVLLAPAFVMLLVAGFSPEFSGFLLVVQLVTGFFLHANVRWRWRPFQRIVITPEFHHWHHSNEPDAHCSNYSVFLPLWDILFGTYFMPEDRRPMVYGVNGPVSAGIVGQLLDPFRGLRNPFGMLCHPVAAGHELFAMIRRGLGQMRFAARRSRRVLQV